MENNNKMVILLSNWYSGATLFTILLNRHSSIVSNGEGFPFSRNDTTRYICSCGKYLDECDFYRYAASHMTSSQGTLWSRDVFVRTPSFSQHKAINRLLLSPRYNSSLIAKLISSTKGYNNSLSTFLTSHYEFIRKAKEYSNAHIYIDGTKSIRRAQFFARDGKMQLKVINLVRDGRAFCNSYIKNKKLGVGGIQQAAKEWKDYVAMSENYCLYFDDTEHLNVRYEDLCDRTEETLSLVFNFIGVPYESVLDKDDNEMHLLGNRMRRTFKGNIKKDTSWQNELSSSVIKEIESAIGKELKKYNYL